jgi:hypothetical protein
MFINFAPVRSHETTILEFSRQFTVEDLRKATNTYYDTILELIKPLTDEQVTFEPHDPHAHDPFAKAGEEHIGWSLAHLVLHVTASLEEGASFSSILARGIKLGGRLRYEPEWQTFTTKAQVIQRLNESRRMVLSYLNAWPDEPHLEILRELSPKFVEKFGEMNAPAAFLFSLMHFDDHLEQFREAARQARELTVETPRLSPLAQTGD